MKYISVFRLRAFLIHLALSIIIALVSLFLVYFIWYPSPLDKATGVTSIYLLMLTLDVCLGPLMTLFLAKQGKKGLKFDFVVIAILQITALLYGLNSIAQSRPVWIVFDVLRFEVVQANEIVYSDQSKISPEFLKPSWSGPRYAAVTPSKDVAEKNQRTFSELQTGVSASMQANLYESIDKSWTIIEEKQHPISELKKMNNLDLVNKYTKNNDNITGWLPLKAFEKPMVVFVDVRKQEIVDIVDLNPYP